MSKMNYAKYILAVTVAAALVCAPTANLIAASGSSASGSTAPASSESSEPARPAAEVQYEEMITEAESGVHAVVEGVKSDVKGFYLTKKVTGVALKPSADANADRSSWVKVSDTDKNKSKAAVASANGAAESIGAVVGPCINVEYGKNVNGKYQKTTDGSKGDLSIGIPANFRSNNATFYVIAVYPGGAVAVYQDQDTNPNTITVNLPQSQYTNVMYAVAKK